MAIEKKLVAISATPFTSDGTQFGVVTIADTSGYTVKAYAAIVANGLPPLQVQIQLVFSSTQMVVGPPGTKPERNNFIDISAYTVSALSQIAFPEQDKNKLKPEDITQAVYSADPVVAIKTIDVDPYGNFYGKDNPLPVAFDGTVSIGTVEVHGSNGNTIEPNADGSINTVVINGVASNKTLINEYNEVNSVPNSTLTNLVTYTVPLASTAILERVSISGENIATYQVSINGTVIDTRRTFWGTLNEYFNFTSPDVFGTALNAGDVVLVTVIHFRPDLASFEGRLQIVQVS